MAREFPEIKKYVNTKSVIMALIDEGRYDLVSVFINSKSALKWLEREVETAKRVIWGETTAVGKEEPKPKEETSGERVESNTQSIKVSKAISI